VFFNVKRKYPGSGEGLQVIAFKTSGASVAPEGKRPGVRVIMREASFRDYDQIAALQIRNGLSTKSYEDWLALCGVTIRSINNGLASGRLAGYWKPKAAKSWARSATSLYRINSEGANFAPLRPSPGLSMHRIGPTRF